jgi:hypothetical protein
MAATATRKAAAIAPPVTEMATILVTGSPCGIRGTDTGCGLADDPGTGGGSTLVTAWTGLIMPVPVRAPVVPSAVASIRLTTCAAVSRGYADRSRAASPETNAAAKLVPWFAGLNPPGHALATFAPGAVTETGVLVSV